MSSCLRKINVFFKSVFKKWMHTHTQAQWQLGEMNFNSSKPIEATFSIILKGMTTLPAMPKEILSQFSRATVLMELLSCLRLLQIKVRFSSTESLGFQRMNGAIHSSLPLLIFFLFVPNLVCWFFFRTIKYHYSFQYSILVCGCTTWIQMKLTLQFIFFFSKQSLYIVMLFAWQLLTYLLEVFFLLRMKSALHTSNTHIFKIIQQTTANINCRFLWKYKLQIFMEKQIDSFEFLK